MNNDGIDEIIVYGIQLLNIRFSIEGVSNRTWFFCKQIRNFIENGRFEECSNIHFFLNNFPKNIYIFEN
jgi:hypothetical protein